MSGIPRQERQIAKKENTRGKHQVAENQAETISKIERLTGDSDNENSGHGL